MENPFDGLSNLLLENKKTLLNLQQEVKALNEQISVSEDRDRYIDKKTASKIAGVSLSTINNWRRAKKVKIYYFDSVVRFHLGEFLDFLSEQAQS